jgi:hypothetical protein
MDNRDAPADMRTLSSMSARASARVNMLGPNADSDQSGRDALQKWPTPY